MEAPPLSVSLPMPMQRGFALLISFALALGALLPLAAASPTRAAVTELFFSEYIEGSSNNKALEIYNGTGGAVDLAAGGYNVQMFFNGSTSAGLTINLTGTVADGDVHVIAQSSSAAAILAQADQTNGAGWFNGDDAVVLRKGTTVLDVVGQIGSDPGSEWGSGLLSTADNTLRRKSSIEVGDPNGADVFDPSIQWDGFATDTFDGLGTHTGPTTPPPPAGAVINEFSASTTGTDVEYVEVWSAPSTDLSDLTILEIEGDFSGTATGTIDEVIPLGSTDAQGLWLQNLAPDTLENGTITLLLVRDFSGALGADLDTNDDGALDAQPWAEVVDAVAVSDGGASHRTYGVPVIGPNYDGLSSFAPGGASRIPDGGDTDTATDWVRNDFDLAGIDGFVGTIQEGEAYNTPGTPNQVFVPPPTGNCGDPATLIHEIQGSGLTSPLAGTEVKIEGIVVGDFQNNGSADDGDLNGFFVQEEDADADADAATSEGIFIFAPGAVDVATGDVVRVVGTAVDFPANNATPVTELTSVGGVLVCDSGVALPAATTVTLPVSDISDFERYEGMLVTFPQALSISEFFNYDRFGEMVLTVDRDFQPTAVYEPYSPGAEALAAENRLNRITLDDGLSVQNPSFTRHPNGEAFTLDNRFRGGDTVANVVGVMDHSFGLYRVQPTEGADYTAVNPRPAAPEDVGGSLTVASFNVLNYFTTLDDGTNDVCGPAADQECRGADDAEELARQQAKIVAALAAIDADIVGLIEIENHPADVPTATLVEALNAEVGAGTYDYLATGAIGTDAIRTAFIYKSAAVTPIGDYAILDSSIDARFDDDANRPVLAQAFMELASTGVVTVAVNHLKSKGSACGDGDDDPVQGNCNGTRTAAAEALADWLATDPTESGDLDALVIGDLNAYDKEDPIDAIRAAGYAELIHQFQGEYAYSYLFDGQLGYLDTALASPTLASQVSGATIWHINADEPDLLDYDTSFKSPEQDAIYAPDPYRSSDHDPVIVGLDLADVDFDGFEPPIDDSAVTEATAGRTIPVKFSLGGDYGLDILFEAPQVYACGGWPFGDHEDAELAGGSSLSYDEASGEYVFAWKTDRAWAGSCLTLVLTFDDGSYATASFEFVRSGPKAGQSRQ